MTGQIKFIKQPDGSVVKQEVLSDTEIQARIDAIKSTLNQLQQNKLDEIARRDAEMGVYQKELDDLTQVEG